MQKEVGKLQRWIFGIVIGLAAMIVIWKDLVLCSAFRYFWSGRRDRFRQGLGPCLPMYLFARKMGVRRFRRQNKDGTSNKNIPFVITFFSAHHSPNTVNRKASEFVIGTVRLSSINSRISQFSHRNTQSRRHQTQKQNSPACPINKKNHTLPVTLIKNGIA